MNKDDNAMIEAISNTSVADLLTLRTEDCSDELVKLGLAPPVSLLKAMTEKEVQYHYECLRRDQSRLYAAQDKGEPIITEKNNYFVLDNEDGKSYNIYSRS